MKRILPLFLCIALLFSACNTSELKSEDTIWYMSSVQSNSDGAIVAYGEHWNGTETNAVYLELFCAAKDGILTLTDRTNEKTYEGTYTLKNTELRSNVYEVTLNEESGLATCTLTTYHDSSQEPTLVLRLNSCSIYFYAG